MVEAIKWIEHRQSQAENDKWTKEVYTIFSDPKSALARVLGRFESSTNKYDKKEK